MAITQIIKSVTPFIPPNQNLATGVTVMVTFADDATGASTDVIFQNISDPVQLATLVSRQLTAYQTASAVKLPAVGTAVDLSVLTPPPPQPTQDQLNQQAYQAAVQNLQQYQQALAAGLIQADDAGLSAALATAQQAYQTVQAPLLAANQATAAGLVAAVPIVIGPLPPTPGPIKIGG